LIISTTIIDDVVFHVVVEMAVHDIILKLKCDTESIIYESNEKSTIVLVYKQ
jgi:hypothetical protein